jgi:rhodanese-related sulfurtransferase
MGAAVIQEGDAGDTFFVIKQGYALVRKQHGKGSKTLAAIRPGQFFGEDALISDQPRGASIIMASDGVLMRLGKEDFRSLLQDSVIRHLSEAELEKLQEENDRPCILLDIRPEMDARHDRIPGARNLPLSELRKPQGHLEKSFIYAICGDTGSNAELGAYLLSDAGFEAYVLDRKSQNGHQQDDTGTHPDEHTTPAQTDNPDQAAN